MGLASVFKLIAANDPVVYNPWELFRSLQKLCYVCIFSSKKYCSKDYVYLLLLDITVTLREGEVDCVTKIRRWRLTGAKMFGLNDM